MVDRPTPSRAPLSTRRSDDDDYYYYSHGLQSLRTQITTKQRQKTMFSTMHRPAYRDDVGPVGLAPLHHTTTALHSTASSPYRPTFSSPLSSSPIRASTMTPPGTPPSPVSPCSSSPIFGASGTSHYNHNNNDDAPSSPVNGTKPSIFKFANRGPARPNPLTAQKREAAQESRRKLFLKNVRQRAEDRRWERRGGEQEVSHPSNPFIPPPLFLLPVPFLSPPTLST